MALWQFLLADGNLPTPTNEQLGIFIACAWVVFSVITKVKTTWWSDGEKQIIARAELAERIALASKSVDTLTEKHDDLDAYTHKSFHDVANALSMQTTKIATLEIRHDQSTKVLEKVSATCEENDKKLTRLLVLCEQWSVIKPPGKQAEKV